MKNIADFQISNSNGSRQAGRSVPFHLTSSMARNFAVITAPQKEASTAPNAYLDVPTEIHFKIFDKLVNNRALYVNSFMYLENNIRILRRVSRGMYTVVREYQKSVLADTARERLMISELPW